MHHMPHLAAAAAPARRWLIAGATVALLLLGGCGAIVAQNPDSTLRPVNAVADGGDARLMLKGADVTAYFTQGRYVQGSPQFSTVYEGVTFRFASAEAKALFDANPTKYLPEYGGYCANGIVYGIPWGGNADTWKMIDGKLYIFGGAGSRDAFLLDVPRNRQLADKYWNEEVKGSNAMTQRTLRTTVNRVAHYKSGAELAAEVAAAKK